ncbi:MAG TPA: shikimate dehydrogenase [Actinopolymorphaceae bacterium]
MLHAQGPVLTEPDDRPTCLVVGSPIAHSLSPVLHRAAYAELGLDWRYEAVELVEDQLADYLDGHPVRGVSVTMPLKQVALALAAGADPVAVTVGAANTLTPVERGWRADNTDVPGAVSALARHGVTDLTGASVVLVGAGGTARGMLAALGRLGVDRLRVLARRPDTAVTALTPVADALGIRLTVEPLTAGAFGRPDLLVATTPAGALDAFADAAARAATVFEVLYDPWPTPLVAAAWRSGARVVGGLDLLVGQAGRQVELMTGCAAAPVEAMRAAGVAALAERHSA